MAPNGTNVVQLPATQDAAQFNPKDQTVSINEIPIPSIKPYGILVKGHEACGTIIQLGSSIPALLRTSGVLMVTGIPQKPLQFNAMDISMNRIRVRGSNNGITPRLVKCLQFSHKHGIKPHLTRFKLGQFQEMLDLMQSGKRKGRLGVVSD